MVSPMNPQGMNLDEKILPEYLKEVGYETHAVGKWHLGFCNNSFAPHNRGFDTHYGHYTGGMGYNDHSSSGAGGPFINHFLNGEPVLQETYEYATYDWASRAKYVLRQNQDTPKFVYLAFNAPHEKVEAPEDLKEEMIAAHPNITMPETRIEQLGAVRAIDLAMKTVVNGVKKLDRETIFIFHSDNGGALTAYSGGVEGPRPPSFKH